MFVLMKGGYSFLGFIFFSITAILFGSSCANMVPPAGGPRDSIPPLLVEAIPADSTLNFKGDRIILEFDEYIDLQDVRNNLLFTPSFSRDPEVSVRGKAITVRFSDALESNTTYVLNFGNAIKDYNEGNVLNNFVYTFSTGSYLDTLELSGKVTLAETGKTDSSKMVVALYRNLKDSAVVNEKPLYISRLDPSGNFRFKNLPPGPFAIYAVDIQSRRYLNKTQLFAFADKTVDPLNDSAITLYAYNESKAPPSVSPTRTGTERRLTYTSNLSANQVDLENQLILKFATPLRNFDSSGIKLTTDSSYLPVEHSIILDSLQKQISVVTEWKPGSLYHLVLDKDFAEDTLGRKLLKTDTVSFTTKKLSDYGQLTIRVRNVDTSGNPVLQFVQGDRVVRSAPISSGIYSTELFPPGDYDLRILFDTNNDGVWTPGEFFISKRQPEIVLPVERKINVKPDWENEFEVVL